jgi:hypothetical protein
VLFPGEELPLRVLSDTNLEAIRYRLANEASMLAVLCPGQVSIAIEITLDVLCRLMFFLDCS